MPIMTDNFSDAIIALLRAGKIGVIRTDTIYGIVGRADDEAVVQRIYTVKHRDYDKQSVILIHDVSDMYDSPDDSTLDLIKRVWPGRVSIIVNSPDAPSWLLRGSGHSTIAYRLPADITLRQLVSQTGPLVAPSANPQSLAPASTIQQAIDYFGDQVDFYVDGGEVVDAAPSQLLRVNLAGKVERLR